MEDYQVILRHIINAEDKGGAHFILYSNSCWWNIVLFYYSKSNERYIELPNDNTDRKDRPMVIMQLGTSLGVEGT